MRNSLGTISFAIVGSLFIHLASVGYLWRLSHKQEVPAPPALVTFKILHSTAKAVPGAPPGPPPAAPKKPKVGLRPKKSGKKAPAPTPTPVEAEVSPSVQEAAEASGGGGGGGEGGPTEGMVDQSSPAKLLTFDKPDYTPAAVDAGIEGHFVIDVFVEPNGSVSDANLRKKVGYGMDDRLIDAAKRAKFNPRTNPYGAAISGWHEIKITMRLP